MEMEQEKDNNIRKIIHTIQTSSELTSEPHNTRLRKLVKQLPRLTIRDNVLYRKYFEHNGDYHLQTVIPEHLEEELMCRIHDQLHHAGMQKCVREFRKRFYFPSIYKKMKFHITNCATCIHTKPLSKEETRTPLESVSLDIEQPGETMMIDLVGPFPTSGGYSQILTAMDVFSRYLFTVPLMRVDTPSIVKAFYDPCVYP